MGFFDKRKNKDDLMDASDAVMEAPPPARPKATVSDPAPPPPVSVAPAEPLVVASVPEPKAPAPPPPLPSVEPAAVKDANFGIDEAVVLVRQLPPRNVDLVMQVVKKTLESVGVDVSKIIEGASDKEQKIEARIAALRTEIDALEAKITAQRREIASLEAEQKEVSQVKERLNLAQRSETHAESPRENTGSTTANSPLASNRPAPAPPLPPQASRAPTPSVAPPRAMEPSASASK